MSIQFKSITELRAMLDAKSISASELTQESLQLAQKYKELNCFVTMNEELGAKNANSIDLENKTTSMLHGKKAAQNSEQAAKEAFSGDSLGSNLPTVKIKSKDFDKQVDIIDLVILSKLENSKSEIRRLLKGKAIKINDQLINDEKLIINNQLFNKNYLKLSIGKKRHIKIEII